MSVRTGHTSAALRASILAVVLAVGTPAVALAAPAQAASATTAQPSPAAGSSQAAGSAEAAAESPYVFADLAVSTYGLDYNQRKLTLTGRLTRHAPDGGPDVPVAGERVDIAQNWLNDTGDPGQDDNVYSLLGTVTTGADGRFRLEQVEIRHRDLTSDMPDLGDFTVRVLAAHRLDPRGPADPSNWEAVTRYGDIGATPAKARLTTRFTKGPATRTGRDVEVEGTFQRKDGSIWRPVKGIGISVQYVAEGGGREISHQLRTDGDGTFSDTVRVPADGDITVGSRWEADPFLDISGDAVQGVPVGIPDPLELHSGPYAMSRGGVVTGSVTLTGSGDCDVVGQRTALQWSADGRTGWRQVAYVRADARGAGKTSVSGAREGYYRWFHAATDTCAQDIGYTKRLRRAR
ncbi:hypothetical protein RKE29_08610 [Streptomyces sp. B1866]|uniref:hypothetical protein n=1 Tax=Streptomyces sp. B1866 TaxID=3075431 RepID=UPI00288FFDDE|nr:hypothetical protein [Streptomyces sp. B1866]MDT3396699.1 hypothetical protein [Streptomyces sp. B1866]